MGSISKSFALILILIIAISNLSLFMIEPVYAQPPVTLPVITISSNGSIQSSLSPSPIVNEGNMYIINENISGYGIDVQCNNILLLGEGNTLQATAEYNTNSGITIETNGVTVENVSIAAFYVGIDVKGLSDKVTGCIITAYDNGINVEGQSNLLTENRISNCDGAGIELSGSNNTVCANTVDCTNGVGIYIDSGSNNNIISRNLLSSKTFDFWMFGNSNNVTYNTITGGGDGIDFWNPAKSNIFCKNDIINNYEGIELDEQPNAFYLNNFINNTYDVRLHILSDPYAPYSMNVFDNGSIGNYWSDYTTKYPNAKEIGNRGIYNTPYVIDGNITDNYPLTTPNTIGSTGAQLSTSSPNPTLSPTPTPTSASSVPELSWLVIVPLLLSLFSVAVIFRHRKTAKLTK
jgi:parallel beta-helix repeat protein